MKKQRAMTGAWSMSKSVYRTALSACCARTLKKAYV
jgi:hypothetical protein